MNKKYMNKIKNNIFPIVLLLVALATIAYFLLGEKSLDGVRQDLKPAKTTISTDTNPNNSGEISKVCYLKKTPYIHDTTLSNTKYIEVNYSENAVVTGNYNIMNVGKDSQKGSFIGAQNGEFINVISTKNAEGKTWEEQDLLKIMDKSISWARGGDRAENENGILMYKDISKLTFEDKIPEVDCKTVNKK